MRDPIELVGKTAVADTAAQFTPGMSWKRTSQPVDHVVALLASGSLAPTW